VSALPKNANPRISETQPVLLYGGTVLTMNRKADVLREAEVLIQRGRITAIGRAITAPPGTRLLDTQSCVIRV
jgi:cytosine/adenosine deaminase-related metal-dependent hydrolase